MTPTATTPAGRKSQSGRTSTSTPSPGHRRKLRQPPGPRAPRRVSGPLGGAGAATAPRIQTRPRQRPAPRTPFTTSARAFLRSLPDHAVIDRLVRGRAWILALGIMLAGIVAMQVEQLKLGASIGRSVQRSSAMAIRNEQLQASVAALADDQRIERMAAQMGMVMTPPTAVGFLSAGKSVNLQNALGNLQAPNATTFLNSPSTNGIVVTPTSLAVANAPPASTTGPASTSGTTSTAPTLTPAATQTTTASSATTTPVGG